MNYLVVSPHIYFMRLKVQVNGIREVLFGKNITIFVLNYPHRGLIQLRVNARIHRSKGKKVSD